MIHSETNQPFYHESSLYRFIPLTKGDSPEPSGQGVYFKKHGCMVAWMDDLTADRGPLAVEEEY
jgi:hypothetical protein